MVPSSSTDSGNGGADGVVVRLFVTHPTSAGWPRWTTLWCAALDAAWGGAAPVADIQFVLLAGPSSDLPPCPSADAEVRELPQSLHIMRHTPAEYAALLGSTGTTASDDVPKAGPWIGAALESWLVEHGVSHWGWMAPDVVLGAALGSLVAGHPDAVLSVYPRAAECPPDAATQLSESVTVVPVNASLAHALASGKNSLAVALSAVLSSSPDREVLASFAGFNASAPHPPPLLWSPTILAYNRRTDAPRADSGACGGWYVVDVARDAPRPERCVDVVDHGHIPMAVLPAALEVEHWAEDATVLIEDGQAGVTTLPGVQGDEATG
ncbi:uncharacterized protein AMSG_06312 [Thecamonas trahens ATCC 50062]|uniref:Uncharacterized protein n=1 Tax=Thecamonas trahens ATCC 50062 TaxID=461836 RepID=A0A0L0DCW4_THETB|nr:hypothetical protein AMSG_06312 [Thecamonas trahens ATCC 50062]KNC50172.1 hypothetical protein AMSG_06312 [Thecamonas trahens ATCC 50062]|eukprot:XP_013757010.1 hypothetical protein AMSG_06312 [Thecamonas trahens ATCC 50062]